MGKIATDDSCGHWKDNHNETHYPTVTMNLLCQDKEIYFIIQLAVCKLQCDKKAYSTVGERCIIDLSHR